MSTRHISLLLLILIIGFALRLYQIDAVAFRGDEAFTVQQWVMPTVLETLQSEIIIKDPQPPLMYLLYWVWGQIFGRSEFVLRLLPALINFLGIVGIYRFGYLLTNRNGGFIAAIIWAVHPFEIWHAQDARNYAIWATVSVMALWLALRALKYQRRRDWVIYGFTALLALYSYYLEVYLVVAMTLYVVIRYWRQWLVWRAWIFVQVSVALALLPWYLYLFVQIQSGRSYGGTTGTFEIEQLFTWFIPVLNFGETLSLSSTVTFTMIAILVFGSYVAFQRGQFLLQMLLLIIIIPTIGIAVVSSKLNVFTPRYIMGIIPAFIMLMVLPLVSKKLWQQIVGWIGVIVWVGLSGLSLNNYWHDSSYQKAPRWDDLAEFLASATIADDLIIQTGADPAFNYYYNENHILAPQYPLPENPQQTSTEVINILENIVGDYPSLWIVGQTLPGWVSKGTVEGWAESHLQLTQAIYFNQLPARQYMNWNVTERELIPINIASFTDVTNLVGYTIHEPFDGNITIWLYWEPIMQTDVDLKVFVHLFGEFNPVTQSPLWAQDDRYPQNGRITTSSWEVSEIYRDVYRVQVADLITGDYEIRVGFYDPANNQRAQINDEDYWVLGVITLD